MKILLPRSHFSLIAPGTPDGARRGRGQEGMAVIVVLVLIVMVLMYATCNIRTLHSLIQDMKSVERQQIRRLAITIPATNSAVITNLNSKVVLGR